MHFQFTTDNANLQSKISNAKTKVTHPLERKILLGIINYYCNLCTKPIWAVKPHMNKIKIYIKKVINLIHMWDKISRTLTGKTQEETMMKFYKVKPILMCNLDA